MNKLNVESIKLIATDINQKVSNNYIGNITVINSRDFFISFSNYRKERLLISLDPINPFVCLTTINNPIGTKVGTLNDFLRKEVKDGHVESVEVLNNDRVLCINYIKTNDYYDRVKKRLIIELIPHRPNLIVLEENTISFAIHYTDALSPHPIIKGGQYLLLDNHGSKNDNESFDLSIFKKECEKYYVESLRKRLQEQFKPVLQHIKSRIKTLNKKLLVLEKENALAEEKLNYQETGTMILTYAYDKQALEEYIVSSKCSYDSSLTPGVNAEKYFTKYKKAKRTLKQNEIEKEKTANEIQYLESCLLQSKYMNEDDIRELANLLFPNKFRLETKNKAESKLSSVNIEGVTIYFGKNAKQNDQLTFKKAQKDYWFFHIKDLHGSHVIVADANPNKETILTACEIALLLSQKECGEVQSAQIRNIKKGSFLGQALLTSYITYNINQIREKTKDLLDF